MNAILLTVVALAALGTASLEVQRNYHKEVGIPLAERIKAREDKILNNNVKLQQRFRIVGGSIAPDNTHPYLVSFI